MIAHVTSAAAVGRKLTMGEAWAATRGKRWRLLGMALLLGLAVVVATAFVAAILLVGIFAFDAPLGDTILVGVVLGLLLVVAWTWFSVRVRALAVPVLMLEPVGVFGALRRSVRLTQRQFWRLLGILVVLRRECRAPARRHAGRCPMTLLSRHRTTALILSVALLAVVLTAWLGRNDRTYPGALDPQNPGGNGAQALARVLDQQGVSVDIVRSAAAYDRATTDASTLVVVTGTDALGRSTVRRLLDHQGDARLVVVAPGPDLTQQLEVGSFAVTTAPRGPVPAGCTAYDGLALRVSEAEAFDTDGCFRTTGGVLLAAPRPGLTLVGAPGALSNDQILGR